MIDHTHNMLLAVGAAASGILLVMLLAVSPAAAQQEPGIELTIEIVDGDPGLVLDATALDTGEDERFVDGGSEAFLAIPGSDDVSIEISRITPGGELFRFVDLSCAAGDVSVIDQTESPVPGMLTSLVIEGIDLEGLAACVLQLDRGPEGSLTVEIITTNGNTTALFAVNNSWFSEVLQVAGGFSASFPANRVAIFGVTVTPPDPTWDWVSTECSDPSIQVLSESWIRTGSGISGDVTCTVTFSPAFDTLTVTNTTPDDSALFTLVEVDGDLDEELEGSESEILAIDRPTMLRVYPAAGWGLESVLCESSGVTVTIETIKVGFIEVPALSSPERCDVLLRAIDAQPVVSDATTEVVEAVSCLAGNGRLDYNIVNRGEAAAVYRIQIGALSPREFLVAPNTWWRSPVTGRRDGPIDINIFKDGEQIVDHIAYVSCDDPLAPEPESPEAQAFVYCVGGNGLVLVQIVNPSHEATTYIVDVGGIRRSQTPQPRGAAVRGVSGRPDGVYEVRAFAGPMQRMVYSTTVTVACDG